MMLLRFSRLRKESMLLAIALVLSSLSWFLFPHANASDTEYLYLTARGESMCPTICDGDVTKVAVCNDGDAIKVGDVITYCTISALSHIPNPTSMWITHRVVEKFQEEEKWIFTTKGDNNAEPDPWKVPEFLLLGIVAGVENADSLQQPLHTEPTTNSQAQSISVSTDLLSVAISILSGTVAVFSSLRRRRS